MTFAAGAQRSRPFSQRSRCSLSSASLRFFITTGGVDGFCCAGGGGGGGGGAA